MNSKELDQQYIMNTYSRQDIVIVKGENATCYDENGKEYIDFGSGIGVNSLGYCDEDWSNAVSEQAKTLQHTSNLYYSKPMADLAQMLCEKTGYQKAFFGNSGAEANECAIKIARKYSFEKYGAEANRNKIITLVNSFHGRTITTLSATGQDIFHNYFHPFTQGFDYVNAGNIKELAAKCDNSVCAIMIELIQGEGGVVPLDIDYVKQVARICKQNDILLIIDEVQTGIGRTGTLLASEQFGISPDITTLAKGLGGGLPIGVCIVNEKLSSVLKPSDHGTTYGGNPVVCAGAKVVLEKVSNAVFLKEVAEKGNYIKNKLLKLNEVEAVDGMGLMLGIQLKTKNAGEVVKACIDNGLLPLTAKKKIRLLPPLSIQYEELNQGIAILKRILNA
ncbi:aspartate aminotransferase family protein [Paludicola sp. MB14-C6]|uniref:aspartate aminotransferase family protein n=1 Tax=Paludihabitans sp. MB14-C6 TaxID=3070656 RepID=UPI0027DD1FBD|nr:aspartate aminotransferase family protein [Paludicola sp. MB14-C6]WMJ22184.1 aspartate aminotransferase family protein [Paludicola sp. MB14-C6]